MATNRKSTRNTFLWKGITEHGMVRTFITKNGKLLIHHHGNMRYFNFFNYRQWSRIVGSKENLDLIFGRAAYVRGGDEALKNGGYLQKRLYLQGCFGRSWKYIALMSTFIPHIMDDARNCPMVARQKIRMFDAFCGDLKTVNQNIKDDLWVGGVKVPFVMVTRPEGLAFKPQKARDIYYIRAISKAHYYYEDARQWLLSNQHRRSEIKGINKSFQDIFPDAFGLRNILHEAGIKTPKLTVENAVQWANEIHELHHKHETDVMLAQDARTNSQPLPGENFIPELEEFRVKNKGDLRRAGIECHHCVGSYSNMTNMVHYRKGQVVCQVAWYDGGGFGSDDRKFIPYVSQCYDFANKTTQASEDFRREIERYLARMDARYVQQFNRTDWEETVALHGNNVIVRRGDRMMEVPAEVPADPFEFDAMPF